MSGFSPAVPIPSNIAPASESSTPVVGTDIQMYALPDHQHPRLSSSVPLTLDANGAGVATFSRSYPSRPKPAFAEEPSSDAGVVTGPPCVFRVKSWIKTGSDFTGANIEGFTLSPPTTQAGQSLLGITVVVAGQQITTYGPAANRTVSVIMLPNSGS